MTVRNRRDYLRDPHPRELPAAVAEHRAEYWSWVNKHADTAMRDTLIGLRDHWQASNAAFFDGRMLLPYITLTEPSAPRIYGQCCPQSSWGSRLEIRLRPSLLDGTHPHLKAPTVPAEIEGCITIDREAWDEGRAVFVRDVLLHEMIHQHVMEHEPFVNESAYHGHGPVFTEHANRIGAQLGLPEVKVRNRKGSAPGPKAAQWPHCVAPPHRYLDVYHPTCRLTAKGVGIPAEYTVSAIASVDGTPLLDIDFDTDSGDKPAIRISMHADTACSLADSILEYLNHLGQDTRRGDA
jgi:hypothetical protein